MGKRLEDFGDCSRYGYRSLCHTTPRLINDFKIYYHNRLLAFYPSSRNKFSRITSDNHIGIGYDFKNVRIPSCQFIVAFVSIQLFETATERYPTDWGCHFDDRREEKSRSARFLVVPPMAGLLEMTIFSQATE